MLANIFSKFRARPVVLFNVDMTVIMARKQSLNMLLLYYLC